MNEDTIVIALCGEACTGKGEIANSLTPQFSQIYAHTDPILIQRNFAAPLYEAAAVKRKTAGDNEWDRIAYELHRVLADVFVSPAYGAPSYKDLVDIVQQAVDFPIPTEGKPREFLQWLGTDICRKINPECLINYLRRSVGREKRALKDIVNIDGKQFGIVISDLRFANEAEFIKTFPSSVLVKLLADLDVRQERALQRDGHEMEQAQEDHASEKSVNEIPADLLDMVLDTSYLTKEEQAQFVIDLVESKLDIKLPIYIQDGV